MHAASLLLRAALLRFVRNHVHGNGARHRGTGRRAVVVAGRLTGVRPERFPCGLCTQQCRTNMTSCPLPLSPWLPEAVSDLVAHHFRQVREPPPVDVVGSQTPCACWRVGAIGQPCGFRRWHEQHPLQYGMPTTLPTGNRGANLGTGVRGYGLANIRMQQPTHAENLPRRRAGWISTGQPPAQRQMLIWRWMLAPVWISLMESRDRLGKGQ